MLFYVAPFQATFRFYFGDMSPLILSKLFKLSSINNLVVSSILRELYLSLYHHVKEHL